MQRLFFWKIVKLSVFVKKLKEILITLSSQMLESAQIPFQITVRSLESYDNLQSESKFSRDAISR